MNPELNYMIAQQRIADLHRASARPRIASEVRAGQSHPRPAPWMAVAAVLVGAGWGSNQFTPMLPVYRHTLGLDAGSLEAMFGVYALGLIPGLFLAGPLSDARGRRLPVLGAAATSWSDKSRACRGRLSRKGRGAWRWRSAVVAVLVTGPP
jgi:MFS family permease